MKLKDLSIGAVVLSGVVLAGCPSRSPEAVERVGDMTQKHQKEYLANRVPLPESGTVRPKVAHNKEQLIAAAGLNFSKRDNPFALFGEEQSFETGIRYQIILGKLSPSMSTELLPPVDELPIELEPFEQQPYRRVVGIYFGDTVKALIRMEDNKTYVVTPGMQVGNSGWYVASIDNEKVLLVRSGNRKPHEITIRLESAPPSELLGPGGGAPAGGTGGGGRVGNPPGGDGGGEGGG